MLTRIIYLPIKFALIHIHTFHVDTDNLFFFNKFCPDPNQSFHVDTDNAYHQYLCFYVDWICVKVSGNGRYFLI